MILGCYNQLLRHCYKPHSQSYPWKPKHFLYCLTHLTFPREAKGGMSLHFFSSQQLAQPFFSSSVWKALRFVFVGTKPHYSQKKKFIRSEAKSYETRDDTWVQMVQDPRSIQVSAQRLLFSGTGSVRPHLECFSDPTVFK